MIELTQKQRDNERLTTLLFGPRPSLPPPAPQRTVARPEKTKENWRVSGAWTAIHRPDVGWLWIPVHQFAHDWTTVPVLIKALDTKYGRDFLSRFVIELCVMCGVAEPGYDMSASQVAELLLALSAGRAFDVACQMVFAVDDADRIKVDNQKRGQ